MRTVLCAAMVLIASAGICVRAESDEAIKIAQADPNGNSRVRPVWRSRAEARRHGRLEQAGRQFDQRHGRWTIAD